jgi:hypothetical protein
LGPLGTCLKSSGDLSQVLSDVLIRRMTRLNYPEDLSQVKEGIVLRPNGTCDETPRDLS